jgi:antitoxin CptB
MRELDAVLQSFVESEVAALPEAELACFEQILDLPDPELLAYLTGRSVPQDPDIGRLIERIRASHRPRA